MEITHNAHIRWACRRGMRELDITLMPFFEHDYATLDDADKQQFIRLLSCDDPDLFNWLMGHSVSPDKQLQRIVRLIQQRNQQRGFMAS